MLFYLDNTIEDYFHTQNEKDKAKIISAFHEIYEACKRRNHIITGDRKTLKFLSEFSFDNQDCNKLYKALHDNSPQFLSLVEKFKIYVKITSGREISITEAKDKRIINTGILIFSEKSLREKTILLAEGIYDVEFYYEIASLYLKQERILNLSLNAEFQNGGGRSSFQCFDKIQTDNNRFCLAVLDSDKDYPNSKVKGPAAEFKKAESRMLPCVDYYIIPAKTAENIIPIFILNRCYENNHENRETINIIENLEKIPKRSESRFFLKLKATEMTMILICDYGKPTELTQKSKYWCTVLRSLNYQQKCIVNDSPLSCARNCIKDFYKPLTQSSRLLKKSIDYLYQISANERKSIYKSQLSKVWLDIGQTIFAWCCCMKNIPGY